MASQWFYARDGRRHGPVSSADLLAFARNGKLLPTDLVWKEGMHKWVPAGSSARLFPPRPTQPSRGDPQTTTVAPRMASRTARGAAGAVIVHRLAMPAVILGASGLLFLGATSILRTTAMRSRENPGSTPAETRGPENASTDDRPASPTRGDGSAPPPVVSHPDNHAPAQAPPQQGVAVADEDPRTQPNGLPFPRRHATEIQVLRDNLRSVECGMTQQEVLEIMHTPPDEFYSISPSVITAVDHESQRDGYRMCWEAEALGFIVHLTVSPDGTRRVEFVSDADQGWYKSHPGNRDDD